jgi:calcineurin-like phosphoesterase
MPVRFEAAAGDVRLQGLLIDLDAETGLATAVERVDERGVE